MGTKAHAMGYSERTSRLSGWWGYIAVAAVLVVALVAAWITLRPSGGPVTGKDRGSVSNPVSDSGPTGGYDLGNGVSCTQCK